jgi:hypothetical protein
MGLFIITILSFICHYSTLETLLFSLKKQPFQAPQDKTINEYSMENLHGTVSGLGKVNKIFNRPWT